MSLVFASCTSEVAPSVVPTYTAVRIESTHMFSRIGCGTGKGEAFRYEIAVTSTSAKTTLPCYADAIIEVPSGPASGTIRVFTKQTIDSSSTAELTPDYTSTCQATALLNVTTPMICTDIVRATDAGTPDDASASDANSDAHADAIASSDADDAALDALASPDASDAADAATQ